MRHDMTAKMWDMLRNMVARKRNGETHRKVWDKEFHTAKALKRRFLAEPVSGGDGRSFVATDKGVKLIEECEAGK